MKTSLPLFVVLLLTFWSCPSEASRQRCSVVVVRDVRAVEAPDAIMKKGTKDYGPVTQVRVDKKTGKMIYCAHGSNCYEASAFDFISPCRLSPDSFQDPDEFFFDAE